QATAEADGAQAPAAAEPEVWILPVSLERGGAEESMGGFGGQQALEDGARVLAAFGTVDLPAPYGVGDRSRAFQPRQLRGQIWFVGLCQGRDQDGDVFPLFLCRRIGNGMVEHLAHAEPVLVDIICPRPDRAGAAADEPPEDEAAAHMPETPPPVFN